MERMLRKKVGEKWLPVLPLSAYLSPLQLRFAFAFPCVEIHEHGTAGRANRVKARSIEEGDHLVKGGKGKKELEHEI